MQEVIEELVKLAKQMSEATKRGQDLGLNDDEVAFYDALAANESAVKAMGSPELRVIAAELVTQVRKNVSIDWQHREGARAKIRVIVKRILKKYGYLPDLQEEATQTVLQQAALLCENWGETDRTGNAAAEPVKLEIVPFEQANPFVTHLPIYSFEAAAGEFSGSQDVAEEGWTEVKGNGKLEKDLFVSKVVGKSMDPTIPDGSYCIFRFKPTGSLDKRILMMEYRGPEDPETGGDIYSEAFSTDAQRKRGRWIRAR